MNNSRFNLLFSLVFLALAACEPLPVARNSTTASAPTTASSFPSEPSQEETDTTTMPFSEVPVVVAFVKDGDIYIWNSSTRQSETVFIAGDVTDVTLSDDGQVIAFLRRTLFEEPELREEFSLWAIQSNGENPRELVSAEILRQRLNPRPIDSTGIAEFDWIPRTHHLVYSGMKYYAPGQDKPGAEDVYLMDIDTLTDVVLAPAGNGIRVSGIPDGAQIVPSPDGRQVALLSGTELSFVNVDGSNLRQAVLTYPLTGSGDVPFVSTGIWTQDMLAFLVNAPVESNPSENLLNFTITSVAVDGSRTEPIAVVMSGNPVSLVFSPDGKYMAFGSVDEQQPGSVITSLADGVGPLAIPHYYHLDYINAHWSPFGDAYVINENSLWRLCPNATQVSQVCGDPVHLDRIVVSIQWMDRTRFLFVTRASETFATDGLFLGTLDGMIVPIATWSQQDFSHSHAAVVLAP